MRPLLHGALVHLMVEALAKRDIPAGPVIENPDFEPGPKGWGGADFAGQKPTVVIVDDVGIVDRELIDLIVQDCKTREDLTAPKLIETNDRFRMGKGEKRRLRRYGERWT